MSESLKQYFYRIRSSFLFPPLTNNPERLRYSKFQLIHIHHIQEVPSSILNSILSCYKNIVGVKEHFRHAANGQQQIWWQHYANSHRKSLKSRGGFGPRPEPESPKISPKMAGPKKPEARNEARRAFCIQNFMNFINFS